MTTDTSHVFYRAIASGAPKTRPDPYTVEVDYSGNCVDPYKVRHVGHGEDFSPAVLRTRMTVRCRKCPPCLISKAFSWANRCQLEINRSHRTWFLTFTLRPEAHVFFQYKGKDKPLLNTEFAEITKAMKRARSRGFDFRYMAVAEFHKSGLPHFHAFLHEKSNPITKRELQSGWFWPHGFLSAKLVDEGTDGAPWYACKYISKDVRSRPRASLKYGHIINENDL